MLRVDLEPAKNVAFQARMASLSLPGLQLIEASASPARVSRTGQYLADGNDDAVLAINRTGIAAVSSGGREEVLHEQEAILMMGNEPTSFYRTDPGRSFTLPLGFCASTFARTRVPADGIRRSSTRGVSPMRSRTLDRIRPGIPRA